MDEYKIFFSYSRVDGSDFSLKLANDLRNNGLNVWIDQRDILPASKWDTEIQKALAASDCLLFIVSAASVASDNVLDEVNYALNNKKKIFPVLTDNSEMPYRVSRLQYIDFRSSYDKGLERLLTSLNLEKNKANNADDSNKKIIETHHTTWQEKLFSKKPLLIIAGILLLVFVITAIYNSANKSSPTSSAINEQQAWENAMLTNDSAAYTAYLQQFPNGNYTDSAKQKLASLAATVPGANAEKPSGPAQGKVVDKTSMEKLKPGKTMNGVKEKFGEPDYDLSNADNMDWIFNLANMDVEVLSFDKKNISAVTFSISPASKDTFLLYPEYYDGYTLGSLFAKRNQTGSVYSDSVYWARLSLDSYVYYTTCEASGGGTVFCAIIGSRDYDNISFPKDMMHMGPDALKDIYQNVAKAKKTYITVFYDFEEDLIKKIDPGGINSAYRKR